MAHKSSYFVDPTVQYEGSIQPSNLLTWLYTQGTCELWVGEGLGVFVWFTRMDHQVGPTMVTHKHTSCIESFIYLTFLYTYSLLFLYSSSLSTTFLNSRYFLFYLYVSPLYWWLFLASIFSKTFHEMKAIRRKMPQCMYCKKTWPILIHLLCPHDFPSFLSFFSNY